MRRALMHKTMAALHLPFVLFRSVDKTIGRNDASHLLHHLFIFLVFFAIHPSMAITGRPTQMVDSVCNQTSDYAFCVDSLYSDQRTPDADQYTLASIAFGLAYTNACNTHDHIAELIRVASSLGQDAYQKLQRCSQDYDKAISALEFALNDLNSETFFELADLSNAASQAAVECQIAFLGTTTSPLASRNRDLKDLCGICVAVAELFTG